MLKKLAKQLLKINWLRREVEAYKLEQKKRQHREHWTKLMHNSGQVRMPDNDAPKIRPFGMGRK